MAENGGEAPPNETSEMSQEGLQATEDSGDAGEAPPPPAEGQQELPLTDEATAAEGAAQDAQEEAPPPPDVQEEASPPEAVEEEAPPAEDAPVDEKVIEGDAGVNAEVQQAAQAPQANKTILPPAAEEAAAYEDAAPDIMQPGGYSSVNFLDYIEQCDIVKEFTEACSAAGRKPSHLVTMSLQESVEAGNDTFMIKAPGSHKLAFTSRITDNDMEILGKVCQPPASCLRHLDLSYNELTDVGAQTLASSLLSCGPGASQLECLCLRSNSIGPAGCSAVCQALTDCHMLTSLDFSHNPLGRDGGLIVVDLLRKSPQLSELYMQDTDADIDVLVAISEALLNNQSQLKVCNIENPRLTTLQEDHTVHFGRMLRVNTCLSEVYLGKVKMRDDGVRQLVSFLLENKTLRVLDLRCNELGAVGATHLGTLLASDCQLAQLNLSNNRIGERGNIEGARAIADALLKNRMLQHLDLNGNSLCGDALKVIADATDQNSTLETLGLFQNQWDQPSAYKFHQILNDRARILPLRADFVTSEVDLRIDVCRVDNFSA